MSWGWPFSSDVIRPQATDAADCEFGECARCCVHLVIVSAVRKRAQLIEERGVPIALEDLDVTGLTLSGALYTVARELGHRSTDMIEDRYGHLHDRTELGGKEVVEFQVEEHAKRLNGRLEALRV